MKTWEQEFEICPIIFFKATKTFVTEPFSHGFARLFPTQATQDPQTFLNPGVHAGLTDAGGRLRSAKLIT